VVDPAAQRFHNRRSHGEIHIGDPEGQDVAAGIFLPFLGVGAPALDRAVEVKGHVGSNVAERLKRFEAQARHEAP